MIFKGKNINATIFDMDGTMFDTEKLRCEMLKKASAEICDKEMSDEFLIDCLGRTAKNSEKLAKMEYGEEYPYTEIRKKSNELEMEHIRTFGVPVKKGLHDVLNRLKKNGVIVALATSSKKEIAQEYLIRADVIKFFDIAVYGNDIENGKPEPDIFLQAALEMNRPISSCIVIEDSSSGLIAAKRAGAIPIYIRDMKDPPPEILSDVFLSYDNMLGFLEDISDVLPKLPMPKLNDAFPQDVGYAHVGIHGFGAIGGGYLPQVFLHWDGYTRPASITGTTRNALLRDVVNSFGRYRIEYESLGYAQTITGVELIDTNDHEAIFNMYSKSDIIAISMPESAVRSEMKTIAEGLVRRFRNGGDSLTILIVMNRVGSCRYFRNNLKKTIDLMFGKESENAVIKKIRFCGSVVNRMSSKISNENLISEVRQNMDHLYSDIENMKLLIGTSTPKDTSYGKNTKKTKSQKEITDMLNRASSEIRTISDFVNEASNINITLFTCSTDMPLYVSNRSKLLGGLIQVKPVDKIGDMQVIKNKLSNGTHAIIAWYSSCLGYKTIGQGMGDLRVLMLTESIMKKELKPALLKDYPEFGQYVNGFIDNFIKRCRTSFKDYCSRVGRDPLRKIQDGERIMGALRIVQGHDIKTPGLEFGLACAIAWSLKKSGNNDQEAIRIRSIFAKNQSVEDVLTFKEEYNGRPFKGLDPENDRKIINNVTSYFKIIMREMDKNDGCADQRKR